MTGTRSWRLRLLELFGDSLFGMLWIGFVAHGLRRETIAGTIVWVLGVIAASVAAEAVVQYVWRRDRAGRGASVGRLRPVPVWARRGLITAGILGIAVLVVGYAGALYWLIWPFLPSSVTGH